jgi:hypothetical protein
VTSIEYILSIVKLAEMPGLGELETHFLSARVGSDGGTFYERGYIVDRSALVLCGMQIRYRTDACTEVVDLGHCEFKKRRPCASAEALY